MKKFEVVEHTADIGIIAYGKDLPELFENAALGMFSILVDGLVEIVKPKDLVSIKVDGVDYESLLVNFLNELVFLCSTKKMLFVNFKIVDFGEYFVYADVSGEEIDSEKHKLNFEIKSATYHNLKIEKTADGLRCQIIFDV